jgi:hypothetical protein
MALHRFPRIREAAVDECWVLKGVGKGVEWGKAGREEERALFEGLGVGRRGVNGLLVWGGWCLLGCD